MASLPQPTVASPLPSITRQRLILFLLLALSLVTTTIAIVAVQRQLVVPVAPAPVPVVQAPAPSIPAPVRGRTAAISDAYEQLQLQRLAAEQAMRAGNTEAYEIAVSGAEALQGRITSLQAERPQD